MLATIPVGHRRTACKNLKEKAVPAEATVVDESKQFIKECNGYVTV
jgi:hypothetical protein